MKKPYVLLLISVLSSMFSQTSFATGEDQAAQEVFKSFTSEYQTLDIPTINLGYVENLNLIQDIPGITRQEHFFNKYKKQLEEIDRSALTFETKFQLEGLYAAILKEQERLSLEREFRLDEHHEPIGNGGLSTVKNGKKWYEWFLKRWISSEMTPDQVFELGRQEVSKVQKKIDEIQTKLGFGGRDEQFNSYLNSPQFLITDQNDLEDRFHKIQLTIKSSLKNFIDAPDVPLVVITPAEDQTPDTPPGIYSEGVFYYNFYQNKFNSRNLDWLFIHEAIPGHHLQGYVGDTSTLKPIFKDLFYFQGFSEGWAAYTENFGEKLEVYKDLHQQLGKWEWDIVRSARLVLDVGLNHRGWTIDQARSYWKQNIKNQDSIMERELRRVVRWPGQVASYKVGEHAMLSARQKCQQSLGSSFSDTWFHKLILERGSMHLDQLRKLVDSVCY